MATRTRGGKKLDAFLRKAKTAKGVNAVEIGFYSTAKYPDGTRRNERGVYGMNLGRTAKTELVPFLSDHL